MSKYELIKKYPGSLNIGEIVTKVERKGVITYENLDYAFSKNSIENYPEFWQKVEEKDYEILKFHDGFNEYYKKENGKFTINLQYEYNIDDLLNKKDLKIHSVKRKDGEIFTVGDLVNNPNYPSFKIKKFEIGKKNNLIIRSDAGTTCPNFLKLEKSKQKLFITEDGVEIREEDKYFTVNQDYLIGGKIAGKESVDILNIFKYFSTKEKAEEYVLLNKPSLSPQQVFDYINKQTNSFFNMGNCHPDFVKLIKENATK